MTMESAATTGDTAGAATERDGQAMERLCGQISDDVHKAYVKARTFVRENPSAFAALAGAFGLALVGSLNARR